MPELPEVETVVRELRPELVGRRITAVEVSRQPLRRRWAREWAQSLIGSQATAVWRRGKWIVFDLEPARHLVLHLGMTGQLTVVPADEPRADHVHLVLGLDDGRQLRFRDIRRFGSATLLPDRDALASLFDQAGLGPEPFTVEPAYWKERLAATRRCVKAVLLDQRVVAGVGNIYADESLFEARLHPGRPGEVLNSREVRRLAQAVAAVLTRAIECRGSSIRNYVGGSGLKGQYQDEFRVYGRTGEPCPRCRRPIACIRLAGRSTHFCPRCQQE